MEIYFDQPYSFFLILVCLVIAGLVSYLLYRDKKQQTFYTNRQLKFLLGLRFLSVFLLAILLLGPAIKRYRQNKFKPILVVAFDNSQSLQKQAKTSEELMNKAKEQFGNFQIDFWTFGEKAKLNNKPDFSELRSDYSNLISTVSENYLGTNIGGLIVIGDGLYNTGNDPVFESKSLAFSVYAIGVGDTTIQTDAAIQRVNTNNTAYLDNFFPVELDLKFTMADGKRTKLLILKDGNPVFEIAIVISGNDYFHQETVRLKADVNGINNFTAVLEDLPGEKNIENNQFDFAINVVSKKQKILFLTHGSHPDLEAIIQTLKTDNNYEWEIVSSKESTVSFQDYNLIIVHQLPDNMPANGPVLADLLKSKRPVLFILGSETSLSRLNNLQAGIEIQPTNSSENSSPVLNTDFSLFTLENDFDEQIQKWPPLLVPFGTVKTNSELQSLIYQKVQSIETTNPLVLLGRIQGLKRGFIIGEGIWRWRIHNFLQNGSHELYDEFIQKIINYLILKPNEDNFNVLFQTEYAEDIPVTMKAELFNDSFEPVNESDVFLKLRSNKGEDYSFVFDKSDNEYKLDIGSLPVGTYDFEANTKLGETDYQEAGSFRVSKLQLEQAGTNANFRVLYQMTANTGGYFYHSSNFDDLKSDLNKNGQLKEQKARELIYQDLISMKWLFAFILLIITLEWFLRKFWGSY